ncbi:MAG: prepilin-type N-terminal cleavage/methylation domain-containing protein [bacterium]|nr:prepilin-type N-terminal cleavage/methylation domain-containing protein [bacterium]
MGNQGSSPRKRSAGFSMAELLIVLSVIGILAAISIPIFLEQKDKAIIGVTKANLDAMRTGLTRHTIRTSDNLYPVGELHYFDFRATVPEANLPPLETEAKILTGSFNYSSDGAAYTLQVTSTNRTAARFRASQAGIVRE